jgi:predicted NBD/HSP70 family sugar kinase
MYLLFDIGGTRMRFALSSDGKRFGKPKIVDTPKKFSDGVSLFKKTVIQIAGEKKIKAAVGGVAGPLNKEKTKIIGDTNLLWAGKPLKDELLKAVDAPVFLENDADLAGLGEAVYGAGKGSEVVAYFTISTGVGGTRIVGGRMDKKGVFGFEPGHQVIDADGTLCGAKHLEGCISGAALEGRYGKEPREIKDSKVWDEAAAILSYGLLNAIVYWSPDTFVLGGPMVLGNPSIPLDKVRSGLSRALSEVFTTPPKTPPVVKAKLGDLSGLHGALAFVEQNLENVL